MKRLHAAFSQRFCTYFNVANIPFSISESLESILKVIKTFFISRAKQLSESEVQAEQCFNIRHLRNLKPNLHECKTYDLLSNASDLIHCNNFLVQGIRFDPKRNLLVFKNGSTSPFSSPLPVPLSPSLCGFSGP